MSRSDAKELRKAAKAIKNRNRTSPVMSFVISVTSIVFAVYCLISVVLTQAEIAEKKQELAALEEKAERLEEANAEYKSILSEEDERVFVERYAVEVLGYAYPNERRFYDTAGK